MPKSITRAQLIEQIASKQDRLQNEDIKLAVQCSFDYLSQALSLGKRIEIRGFGCFALHFKKPKTMRNPRTKELMDVCGRNIPHFKPSSIVNKRLNETTADNFTRPDGVNSDEY